MTNASLDKEIFCFDCKQYLSSNQFARRKASKNFFQPRCYSCFSRRSMSWRAKKKKEKLIASGQILLRLEV